MTTFLALLCGLFLTGCLSQKACEPCNKTSGTFLGSLAKGQTSKAFEGLFENSLISEKSLKSQQFVRLTNGLLRQYGDIRSYEAIDSQKVGRITSTSYLLYQDRGASRWTFFYYRSPESEQWRLLDINASDNSSFLIKTPNE